jgi:hypothetical protein
MPFVLSTDGRLSVRSGPGGAPPPPGGGSGLPTPDFDATGMQAWYSAYQPVGVTTATLNGQTVVTRWRDLSGNGYDLIQPVFEQAPVWVSGGTAQGVQIPPRQVRTFTSTGVNTTTGVLTTSGGGQMFTTVHVGDSVTLTTSNTLPTPFATNTAYFLGNVSGSTCQLFATRSAALAGTSPILPTNTGSGTQTINLENRSRFLRSLGPMIGQSSHHQGGASNDGLLTGATQFSVFLLLTPMSNTGSLKVLDALSRATTYSIAASTGMTAGRWCLALGSSGGYMLRAYSAINDAGTNNTYTSTVTNFTADQRVVLEAIVDLSATAQQFRATKDGTALTLAGGNPFIDGTSAGSLASTSSLCRILGNGDNPHGASAVPACTTFHEEVIVARSGGVTPEQRTSIVNALLARTA